MPLRILSFSARSVLAAGVAVLLIFAGAGAASAHTQLLRSDPADGAELAKPPARITLTFTEAPLPEGLSVRAVGAAGDIELPAEVTGTAVVAAWPAAATSGRYRVSYRVVSDDGHPVQGSLAFTIAAPPRSPSAATGPSAGTAASPAEPSAPADASAAADGSQGSEAQSGATHAAAPGGVPAWLWILAAFVIAGAAIMVVRLAGRDDDN